MRLFPIFIIVIVVLLTSSPLISKSVSAKKQHIIIDAETHQYLAKLANPILKAAKINSDSVRLHIVHNETLNAFVTGGRNIFNEDTVDLLNQIEL